MYRVRQTNDEFTCRFLHEKILYGDDHYDHIGNVYWLVEHIPTGEFVGFAIGTNIGDGLFYLSRSGVLKEHRGNGLHKRLIGVRERYAKRHGYTHVLTYTIQSNPQSFAHLIKLGYELYEPDYAWVGYKNIFYFRKCF
jgi:GNAT superfamily N-acetyltransferase